MGTEAELLGVLDGVDPFWDQDAGPIFSDDDMERLAGIPAIEDRLLDVATDGGQPLARRYAAVEALFQGGWTDWRAGSLGPEVARVMAAAIQADRIHNRWGLPGHFFGRSATDLLSIPEGVEDALRPLLDDTRPLTIHGGETSTVADTARYRVADLAGYLLAARRGEEWGADPDVAARDEGLERLRAGQAP